MNADGTDLRRLTRTPSYEEGGAACSPDGTQIAFGSNRQNQGDIFVMNADGSNVRRLTTKRGCCPTWSPAPPGGGTSDARIAYSRETRGSEIYVMNADGSNEQRLTTTAMDAFDPYWSPDGTQIVCVVDSDPDPWGEKLTICVLNVRDIPPGESASTAHLRPLPRPGDDCNDWPAWSPTGLQIAFSAVIDGHRDIYVVDADGTNLRQITRTKDFDEMAPAWSPDGTQIVFMANPDAHWDIYTMNADGTDQRRLTTHVGNDVDPCWCP
jgi:TolB protein